MERYEMAKLAHYGKIGKFNKRAWVLLQNGNLMDVVIPVAENAQEFKVRVIGDALVYAGDVESKKGGAYYSKPSSLDALKARGEAGYTNPTSSEPRARREGEPRSKQERRQAYEDRQYSHFSEAVWDTFSDENAKVMDKIRKLLALSTSSNPNEAALAMSKAKQLMADNGIDPNNLSAMSQAAVGVDTGYSKALMVTTAIALSRIYGLVVTKDNFTYGDGKFGQFKAGQMFFAGDRLYCEVAMEEYKYLYQTGERLAKEKGFYKVREFEQFMSGFDCAVAKKLYEHGEAWIGNAKDRRLIAEKYCENKGYIIPYVSSKKVAWSATRASGQEAGRGVGLNRQTSGSSHGAIGITGVAGYIS